MDLNLDTFGKRLRFAREQRRLSQPALATLCGWDSQGRISNYELDKREPTFADARRLASALEVQPEWLIEGAGEPSGGPRSAAHPPAPEGAEASVGMADDYAFVPQYDAKGACGLGKENTHVEIRGQLAFKRDWLARAGLREGAAVAIYAEGDSMRGTIDDGDVVVLDLAGKEPRNGKIYALRWGGELVLKRLTWGGTGWIIRSDNPDKLAWPDVQLSPEQAEHLEIVGRAVWRGGGL